MNKVKIQIRKYISRIAYTLHRISHGKITPNSVTLISFFAHIPIMILIARGEFFIAALLLIFFGLFDVLDGELARLQKSTSSFGAFLDSTTDRAKELFIYIGAIWYFTYNTDPTTTILAAIALGISLIISYINAAADANSSGQNTDRNHTYRTGFAGFEIRTALLVIGLLIDDLQLLFVIISLLGIHTIVLRMWKAYKTLL